MATKKFPKLNQYRLGQKILVDRLERIMFKDEFPKTGANTRFCGQYDVLHWLREQTGWVYEPK
jgi:hypothetical protein